MERANCWWRQQLLLFFRGFDHPLFEFVEGWITT
jgi:hypothetical protein